MISLAVAQAQSYVNPVIAGFNPDPSICKVGEDYYLVTSTFEYFPGTPVYHSRDLIHWELIGNVFTRESQLPLQKVSCSGGVMVVTIRYHKGTFYAMTTLGDKNFYVTTRDIRGEWSEPIFVDHYGIDCSMFFDEDNKCYFQTNRGASKSDERGAYQSEIDVKTGK